MPRQRTRRKLLFTGVVIAGSLAGIIVGLILVQLLISN